MNLLINFCLALFVLVSLLMVLVILMQRPKSEGLGAAFGAGVHGLAGRYFLRADACLIDSQCSQRYGQQCIPARTDEVGGGATKFAGACGSADFSIAGSFCCAELWGRRFASR